MNTILIRGGTVVDGSGAPAFAADVRVQGKTIVEVAPGLASREDERVIDAKGCYVTPGFIESHTHFDATMWWQADLDPLPGYGATTVVMGNCGFSAAPISDDPEVAHEMIKIFSFFEDIPEGPFKKNLPWDWRTWSEYQRSMTTRLKMPANYGSFVGHIAIRLAAMGMDAWSRAATPAEIERMAELLEDAMQAGALGMSSNLLDHDGQDRPIPTLLADDAEFDALMAVLARHPGCTLQVIVDTFMRMSAPASVERITRLLQGKKLRVQIAGGIPTLEFQKPALDILKPLIERAQADGHDIWPGFAHVSPTNTLSLTRSLIFAQSNDYVWHEVVLAETEEAKLALLNDPRWRARARESWDTKVWPHAPMANPQRLHLRNSDNGMGPINLTLQDYADQRGLHASDAMAEWIVANGVRSTVHMAPFPMLEDLTIELLKHPQTVGNISDAPAHGQMFCGGGENILLLTRFCRDEGRVTIEEAIHVMTGKLARHFNLNDRGVIRPGLRADIVVFDLAEIQRREEYKRFDVPNGDFGVTWRYTRDAAPMRLTMVNGLPTFFEGRFTGAMPGEFVSPRAAAPA